MIGVGLSFSLKPNSCFSMTNLIFSLSRLRLSIVSGTGNAAPLLMSQIRSTTVTTQDLLNPCLKMDKTSYWYLTVLLFF